jgi:transposase
MEDSVAKLLVPDELWELIRPLLPEHRASPKGGHPPVDDRVCLSGILFVLRTGIPWEEFPQEMGCRGMTLWNRLDACRKACVWERLHGLLLARLRQAEEIDFDRVVVDSSSVLAVHGGKNGAEPHGPGQGGVQAPRRHRHPGHATGGHAHRANVHDVTQLIPLVDAIPPIRGKVGRRCACL